MARRPLINVACKIRFIIERTGSCVGEVDGSGGNCPAVNELLPKITIGVLGIADCIRRIEAYYSANPEFVVNMNKLCVPIY